MIDKQLLEQIDSLNRTFLQPESRAPSLKEGIQAVADITDSAALLVDEEGTILNRYLGDFKPSENLHRLILEETFSSDSEFMSVIKSGVRKHNQQYLQGASIEKKNNAGSTDKKEYYSVLPIPGREKSAVYLFLFRSKERLSDTQLTLAEIGATLLGMLLRQAALDLADEEARNRELAAGAFESLSYSEVEAIQEILKNINNNESVVVASKIADRLGITRSVIVNALRKFESAGIIESRSLGMKGTFIRVKNLQALELIASRSSRMGHFS